jgi:type II secretory pathway pseudopilin PulG
MPRSVLVVAISLGVLLAIGVSAVGMISHAIQQQQQQTAQAAQQALRTGPLALPPVPAPKATTPECSAVLAALPGDLMVDGTRVPRRQLAAPAPPATVAWGDPGHDPMTVRCGIEAPGELTPTAELVVISGVSWLQITESDVTSWIAVDRPVYVALTLPANSGSGPVQEVSAVLASTLPAKSVFPITT